MKYLLSVAFLVSVNNLYATPSTINEAIKKNTISVLATGNSTQNNPAKSSYRGKCLKLNIKNNLSTPQEIKIETANHFTNEYETKQDLISTENYIVKLLPNETKIIAINALCGEKNNSSPDETDTFKLSYKHTGGIEKLTAFFDKKKTFDNSAQQAMWCLTDNNNIENIYDTDVDTTLENELVKLVAEIKGVDAPKRKGTTSFKHRVLRYPVDIIGSHSEHIDHTTTIGFYLTDTLNNILVTITEDDTESRQGTVKYSYGYRGQLAKGKYYFQMKRNGAWIKKEEIVVPDNQ